MKKVLKGRLIDDSVSTDNKTSLKDGSVTVARNFFMRDTMLKKAVTTLTDDLITINNLSPSLTLLLSIGLVKGKYTMTVITQFGSAVHIQKRLVA